MTYITKFLTLRWGDFDYPDTPQQKAKETEDVSFERDYWRDKAEELEYKLKAMEKMNNRRKKSSIVSSGYNNLIHKTLCHKESASLFLASAFLMDEDFEPQ